MGIKLIVSAAIVLAMAQGGAAFAQATAPTTGQNTQAPASQSAPAAPPLHLNTIGPPPKLQFPPANPRDFTAASPTTQVVNAFLKAIWGYDPNRAWQVMGIQSTQAPGITRVTILVGEQGVSHTPAPSVFFVTADGHHAIAGTNVISFGAHPFAAIQQKLELEANGPYRGASSKNLELVEFADLQCPDCKMAAPTMDKLATDFPNARIVFEYFPLTTIHAEAEKAAQYGACVAQQKGNAAFFQFVQAVFDTQDSLKTDAEGTLKAAATKAGADAAAVATCADSPAAADAVAASVKLGTEIEVTQTPTLFVNGRQVPVTGIPYSTLKQIVSYAAEEGQPAAGGAE